MHAAPAYISVGANRASSSSVRLSSGLVAFGAGRFVALWDPEDQADKGVYATLPGHKSQVCIVKSLPYSSHGVEGIVSGDSSGEVRLWTESSTRNYECSMSFEAQSPHSICALGIPPRECSSLEQHIFTGVSNGLVLLYKLESGSKKGKGKATEVERIHLGGKLPLDIAVGCLPGSGAPILAIACTDQKLRIYTRTSGRFQQASPSSSPICIELEGHEDWIRSLSFTPYPSSSSSTYDLVLASGSQDNYARLWRISALPSEQVPKTGVEDGDGAELDLLDDFEKKLAGDSTGQISTKAHVFSVGDGDRLLKYSIAFEALLVGHEAGLTDVNWSPSTFTHPNSSSPHALPILASTAADNSLIIWSPSSTEGDGIWVAEHRFGSMGGRGLAFHGALWGKEGRSVLASGWNGGIERWVLDGDEQGWKPVTGVSGHFGDVESLTWDPNGDYILSVSADQTARIHAPSTSSGTTVWTEIARPQIHGYDMTDAVFLSPLRFASGADEKVTRVFDAPAGFVSSLSSLGVQSTGPLKEDLESRPKGATVPPLGLSNRALGNTYDMDLPATHVQNEAIHSVSQTFTSLPTEEELASTTLWPEVEKVYGHGYEIAAVAASHDGKLLATASRSSGAEHASVRLVSTKTWDLVGQPLAGHTLTVTRIAFSSDDEYVLTSSRDRGWRLFRREAEGQGYSAWASDDKAHTRMVLDCCWVEGDGRRFVTASRDKTVKIWDISPDNEKSWRAVESITFTKSITAVDATTVDGVAYLAIGEESGVIHIYRLGIGETQSTLLLTFDPSISHVGAVNRLAWRPARHVEAKKKMQLASCSEDRSVRVFDIDLEG
ncbi:elongator protein [Naematelia encephala]|uniref:Elongator complex protein 2 n=1 Tax=Naematelia encephala TaxID=71784 RepID=A0A1Y2B1H0_9TREE|nr:elongator protein [Naematelia encephala]